MLFTPLLPERPRDAGTAPRGRAATPCAPLGRAPRQRDPAGLRGPPRRGRHLEERHRHSPRRSSSRCARSRGHCRSRAWPSTRGLQEPRRRDRPTHSCPAAARRGRRGPPPRITASANCLRLRRRRLRGGRGARGAVHLVRDALRTTRASKTRRSAGCSWDAAPKILPEIPPRLGEYAAEQLTKRGVEIRVGTTLESVEQHAAQLSKW